MKKGILFFAVMTAATAVVVGMMLGCGSDNGGGGGGNPADTDTYTLTVSRAPTTGGTVDPAGTTTHNAGAEVTVTATPNDGYEFVNWTAVNGAFPSGVTATDLAITFNINNNVNIRANFAESGSISNPWDEMSCRGASVCTPITNQSQWDDCPMEDRLPAATCTPTGDDDPPENGTFTDSRDGQTYRFVTIGAQTWMAENLNFDTLGGSGSWCYDNDPDNCEIFGRMYNWTTAMAIDPSFSNTLWNGNNANHQGVCPAGWRVPNHSDWIALYTTAGGNSGAGTKLKSQMGWSTECLWGDYIPGTDEFGFSALPGGGTDGPFFIRLGSQGLWWSTVEDNAVPSVPSMAMFVDMACDHEHLSIGSLIGKNVALSLRCVRN